MAYERCYRGTREATKRTRIIDDDGIGSGEVDAKSSSASRQQETKVLRALRVEVVHALCVRATCSSY